jgi:tetratricopeptide (TPR) repeat protein
MASEAAVAALNTLVANAYRDASLAGLNMRTLAEDLESVRQQVCESYDIVEPWHAVNTLIANRHPDGPYTRHLIELRDDVLRSQVSTSLAELDALATTDPTSARGQWVRLLGQALTDLWASVIADLGQWMAQQAALDSDFGRQASEAAHWMDTDRWVESMPFIERVCGDADTPANVRFDLSIHLAEIALFRLEDVPTFRRWLDAAARLRPSDPDIPRHLSDLAAKRSDWADSDDERNALLDQVAAHLDESDALAKQLGERGGETLRRRADLQAKLVALAERGGNALPATETGPGAEFYYREAVAQDPWNAVNVTALAGYLLRTRVPPSDPEVARLSQLAPMLEPNDAAETLTELGSALVDSGHVDEAEQFYQQALGIEPDNLDAIMGFGVLLQSRGDLEGAASWLAGAEERCPESFELARARAWVAESQERWQESIAHLQRAQDLRPGAEAIVRADLAWLNAQLGQLDEAERHAASACRALMDSGDTEGPALVPATNRLLDVVERFSGADDPSRALGYLDIVRELRGVPFEADYRNRRGTVLYRAVLYDQAAAEYRLAIAADPGSALYFRNLSNALFLIDDLDGAQDACESAFRIDGDTAEHDDVLSSLSNRRGNIAFERGDFVEAVTHYREAVRLLPTDAVLQSNLAGGLQATMGPGNVIGPLREAVAALSEAARLDPTADYGSQHERLARRLTNAERFGELILSPSWQTPIAVEFSSNLVVRVDPAKEGQGVFEDLIPAMKTTLREELGFDMPGVRLREGWLPDSQYRILLFGVPRASGTVVVNQECLLGDADRISDFATRPGVTVGWDPVREGPCIWASPEVLKHLEYDGHARLTDTDFVFRHLADVLRRSAHRFFGLQDAEEWLASHTSSGSAAAQKLGSRDQPRYAAWRSRAIGRALRGCVLEGIRIDAGVAEELTAAIDAAWSSDSSEATTMETAAAAVVAVCSKLIPTRSSSSHAARATSLFGWAEVALQHGVPLPARQELELTSELRSEIEVDGTLTLVTSETWARPYLRRLVSDSYGLTPGRDLLVLGPQQAALIAVTQESSSAPGGEEGEAP